MIYGAFKNISVRILVAACVLMQLAVMLPHHHHGDSNIPCINVFHCTGGCADECGERRVCGCGRFCGHHAPADSRIPADDARSHDDGTSPCVLSLTQMLRLERERIQGPSEFTVQLLALQTGFIHTVHDAHAAISLNTLARPDRDGPGIGAASLTAYIAAAIPPRAPSFTA